MEGVCAVTKSADWIHAWAKVTDGQLGSNEQLRFPVVGQFENRDFVGRSGS